MKDRTHILIIITFIKSSFSTPTCPKSELDQSRFIWYTCGASGNTNKWFGVSLQTGTLDVAKSDCDDVSNTYQSELIWIEDQNVDICAYYALKLYAGGREFSTVSSLQKFGETVWRWCPGNTNIELEVCVNSHPLTYENWGDMKNGENCMELFIEKSAKSFSDYNWRTKDCGDLMYGQNRFMCVVDCSKKK